MTQVYYSQEYTQSSLYPTMETFAYLQILALHSQWLVNGVKLVVCPQVKNKKVWNIYTMEYDSAEKQTTLWNL